MYQQDVKSPGGGAAPSQPLGQPSVGSAGSHKSLYIIGLVVVIVVLAVTAYYVMFMLPPIESPEKCGNNVCDPGESYDTCPQDCEEEAPAPSGPIIVSVDPSSATINNGDTITLEIKVADVADLRGFEFDVEYDENVLSFSSTGEGTFLSQNKKYNTYCVDHKESPGLVSDLACAIMGPASPVNGDGVIQTITFTGIGSGTSPITLKGLKFVNSKIQGMKSTVTNGEVTVS